MKADNGQIMCLPNFMYKRSVKFAYQNLFWTKFTFYYIYFYIIIYSASKCRLACFTNVLLFLTFLMFSGRFNQLLGALKRKIYYLKVKLVVCLFCWSLIITWISWFKLEPMKYGWVIFKYFNQVAVSPKSHIIFLTFAK